MAGWKGAVRTMNGTSREPRMGRERPPQHVIDERRVSRLKSKRLFRYNELVAQKKIPATRT